MQALLQESDVGRALPLGALAAERHEEVVGHLGQRRLQGVAADFGGERRIGPAQLCLGNPQQVRGDERARLARRLFGNGAPVVLKAERRAVIGYVRALQLSRRVKLDELPVSLRSEAEEALR